MAVTFSRAVSAAISRWPRREPLSSPLYVVVHCQSDWSQPRCGGWSKSAFGPITILASTEGNPAAITGTNTSKTPAVSKPAPAII
jgi:hypothetical protein